MLAVIFIVIPIIMLAVMSVFASALKTEPTGPDKPGPFQQVQPYQ